MTDSKYLHYGDCIYIKSSEDPPIYLSARSIIEESAYFVHSKYIDQNAVHYENQSELMFIIYPKLNYQAHKNFTKLKTSKDDSRQNLLIKRLDVENEQNADLLRRSMGTIVNFGSEIQLFHVYSKSFLKATREKSKKNNSLIKLKLSRKGGSGFYFKIIPYYSFKKEGEKLTTSDKFYLRNPKLDSDLFYQDPSEEDSKKVKQEKIMRIPIPKTIPLLELSDSFAVTEAGLKAKGFENAAFSTGIFSPSNLVITAKQLCWGDYVRIKYMFQDKMTGFLYSDHTVIGDANNVYCRTIGSNLPHEKDSSQAIFQIVPVLEEDYGNPITLQNQMTAIRLKHFITGRYLDLSHSDNSCKLSPTLDEFLAQHKKAAAKFHKELHNNPQSKSSKYLGFNENIVKLHSRFRDTSFKKSSRSGTMKDSVIIQEQKNQQNRAGILDLFNQQVNEENKKSETNSAKDANEEDHIENPLLEYLLQTKVNLKNTTQDGSTILTTGSIFVLISSDLTNLIRVNHNPTEIKGSEQQYQSDANTKFLRKFNTSNYNPLDSKEHTVKVTKNSDQFFFFSSVQKEEISEIMAVESQIHNIYKLLEVADQLVTEDKRGSIRGVENSERKKPPIKKDDQESENNPMIIKDQGLDSIRKIGLWISNKEEGHETGNLTMAAKQKMLRELGLIDILVETLSAYNTSEKDKSSVIFKQIIQVIVNLLKQITHLNKPNNYYLSQWGELLLEMALDKEMPTEIGLDQLVSQLFHENLINIKNLSEFTTTLCFEDFDSKALNIAVALCRYNPSRTSKETDDIVRQLVLAQENRDQIFRRFRLDEKYLCIDLQPAGQLKIDKLFEYREEKQFNFILGNILLAAEITKLKPMAISPQLFSYFPKEVCIAMFRNNSMNAQIKSVFLKLFTQIYFNYFTAGYPIISFPNSIKFLKGVNEDKDFDSFDRLKDFQDALDTNFDLKEFIKEFLDDPHKWSEGEHDYVKAIMELIYSMCLKGLYSREDLLNLKYLIFNYLKVGLATIHEEIAPPDEEDIKNKDKRMSSKLNLKKNSSNTSGELKTKATSDGIDKTEPDEDDEDEKEKESSWKKSETAEMLGWMKEIMKILIFIEKKEIDSKLQTFFREERTSKFFNEKLNSRKESVTSYASKLSTKVINKIKKDKESYVFGYLNDNFVLQDYKHILLLIEMLLINDIYLTCDIVHLLYLDFSVQKRFLQGVNSVEIITDQNFEVYNTYKDIYDKILQSKLKLDSFHDDELAVQAKEIFPLIHDQMSKLVNSLMNSDKEETSFIEESYQIYDDLRYRSGADKEKQSLLRNMDYFAITSEIFIKEMNIDYTIYEDKTEFAEVFIKFFLFFCFNNPENQKIMASSVKFIESLFLVKYNSIQWLVLRLIMEIYRDNYGLLSIVNEKPHILHLLVVKFYEKAQNLVNYEKLEVKRFLEIDTHSLEQKQEKNAKYLLEIIDIMRILPSFFQIKFNYLAQNQILIAKEFRGAIKYPPTANMTITNYDDLAGKISSLLNSNLKHILNEHTFEKCVDPLDPNKTNIPLDIAFAIHFLSVFSLMVTGTNISNSQACLSCKAFLSITQIKELLEKAGEWYPLKLALVNYFNNVFLKDRKLENEEINELDILMKEYMFNELDEYLRFRSKRHLYSRNTEHKYVSKLSFHYSTPYDLHYAENVDDAYHQLILFGVIESFKSYGERIKSAPSDSEYFILDKYVTTTISELKIFWNANTVLTTRKIDNVSSNIRELPEPSDPDLNDGDDQDLFMPQKKIKSVSFLKRELRKNSREMIKSKKAQELTIYKLFKEKKIKSLRDLLLIDAVKIEEEHSQQLETLVKFLLELKIASSTKFKKIISSFMEVLISFEAPSDIKQSTLKILRRLSNYKDDPVLYESIQVDFIQLDLIHFFLNVIINSKGEDDKLEFVLGVIDFLDEASVKIQQEFLEALMEDEENLFLLAIREFISENMEEFRENEKNLEQASDVQSNARTYVYKKMLNVIYPLELLRLTCENHYLPMQNYLREQILNTGIKIKKSTNFIVFVGDLLNRYVKNVHEQNIDLGIKILDCLIEFIQGPCIENQVALLETKILENLEDLTLIIQTKRSRNDDSDSENWAKLNMKVIQLIQSILEGSNNQSVVQQVSRHILASVFLDRLTDVYKKYYKKSKKIPTSKYYEKKNLKRSETINIDIINSELNLEEVNNSAGKKNYKLFLDEAISIAILLYFLNDLSPEIQRLSDEHIESMKSSPSRYQTYLKAEKFYFKNVAQIEIVNKKNDLQRVYFPIEKKTKYLSDETKSYFLETVPRDSSNEKLFGLIRYRDVFIDEMNHFLSLNSKGLKFSLAYFTLFRNLNLLLAFVTNIVILAPRDEDLDDYQVITNLGYVHIILSSIVLMMWIIFKAPLDMRLASRNKKSEEDSFQGNRFTEFLHRIKKSITYYIQRLNFMLFNTYMLYYLAWLIFSILGTVYSRVFFSFLLLDLIDRSSILNNVIKSITKNYKQLLMTLVLGVILMYIYAVIAYFTIIPDFQPEGSTDPESYKEICSNIWQCLLTIIGQGLRQGGGIGDVLNQPSWGDEGYAKRYLFDLIFFIMIIIILLNIIFGIIIDTFAELRNQKEIRDFDEKTRCFICNIDRTTFEKDGLSFEKHTRIEHNIWNYLYFMVNLEIKDKMSYNGTESYVAEKIEREDISWFPIARALSISKDIQDSDDDLKLLFTQKFEMLEKKLFAQNSIINQQK